MSVASELNRLLQAKSDLATSIENKGVTVPAATTIDGYAALVDQIQQGGGSLPYDAEVEWIKSNGSAVIDTGIRGGSNVIVECSAYCETGAGGVIFGEMQRFNSSMSTTRCMIQIQGSGDYFQFFANTNTTAVNFNKVLNQWVTISGDWSTGSYTVGTTNKTSSVVQYQDYTSIYLFGRHINHYNNTSTFDNVTDKVRLRSVQIKENGNTVRDFIPVRVGTVGYMYDRVSGVLFGSAGTGSFTLGSDVT